MRKILATVIATALVGASGSAGALVATTTFNVTATVLKTCSVSATGPVAFGNYTPLGGNINSTTTVNVNCTKTTPYTVALDKGTTAGGTIAQRLMANGGNTLQYNLYTDAAHSTLWGDGVTGVTQPGVGSGVNTSNPLTVYGQLPDSATNQGAVPGNYQDTITVTVTY